MALGVDLRREGREEEYDGVLRPLRIQNGSWPLQTRPGVPDAVTAGINMPTFAQRSLIDNAAPIAPPTTVPAAE
jgi:hypothetical protein